jgi:carbamoyl-phosphate synthase large subunit
MSMNLLLTGAGAPGFYGIYSCLKENYAIFCCDADPHASGAYLGIPFKPIPKAYDETFIEALVQLCKEWKIEAILSFVTAELEVIASNYGLFEREGIRVIMAEKEVLHQANNKLLVYQKLKDAGLNYPVFQACNSKTELMDALTTIPEIEGKRVFKPAISNGSRGLRIILNELDFSEILFNQKPGNPEISSELFLHQLPDTFPDSILSEYLPGAEYSVDMICDHGRTLLCLPRLRLKVRSGVSTQCRADLNSEIMSYCKSIVRYMDLHGFMGLQIKLRSDGSPVLIEINPRLQGGTSMWRLLGVNIPLIGLNHFLYGREIPDYVHNTPDGRMMNRYACDL